MFSEFLSHRTWQAHEYVPMFFHKIVLHIGSVEANIKRIGNRVHAPSISFSASLLSIFLPSEFVFVLH